MLSKQKRDRLVKACQKIYDAYDLLDKANEEPKEERSKDLVVEIEKNGREALGAWFSFSNGRRIVLGGAGKIRLYRDHLTTLANIQTHLSEGKDLSSILIALATGTGKTYVQALWLLVLMEAGMNGIFAIPNKLLIQFKSDLSKLLPNELVDNIPTLHLEMGDKNEEAVRTLTRMTKSADSEAKFVICSFEELLDEHYPLLQSMLTDEVAISFDEQDLVMKKETRKLKLKALAMNKLTMFLTATPSKETYELCHRKPVAYMSNKQKALRGHGEFPVIKKSKALNLDDKKKGLAASLSLYDELWLKCADVFEGQRSSPIVSLFEALQCINPDEYFNETESKTTGLCRLRWYYQPPTSRKMLVLINDAEELINLHNFLMRTDEWGDQQPDKQKKGGSSKLLPIYHNGNLFPRANIYQLIDKTDTDKLIGEKYAEQKKALVKENKEKFKAKHEKKKFDSAFDAIIQINLLTQLDNNIFAGIVEYIFSDLTGYTTIDLNKMRKRRFSEADELIQRKIKEKCTDMDEYGWKQGIISDYLNKLAYSEKNLKGIEEEGALLVALIIADILEGFARLFMIPNPTEVESLERQERSRKQFIENWSLHNQARDQLLEENELLKTNLDTFCDTHRVLYVMEGVSESGQAIKDGNPFSGFSEKAIPLKSEEGLISQEAKRRHRSAVEEFDPYMQEHHYTPKYSVKMTEEMADNCFKLGFVGMYVSNKKTEGFSDLNLHTVMSTIPHAGDGNNDPTKTMQRFGRLRGKDPTQVPYYFCASGREVTPAFDLMRLTNDEDYFPYFFKSKALYNTTILRSIGEDVAEQIALCYKENRDECDQVDLIQFNKKSQLIVLKAFRQIYSNASHQMQKGKSDLYIALAFARAALQKKIDHIKKPFRLSTTLNGFSGLLATSSQMLYALQTYRANHTLQESSKYFRLKDTKEVEDQVAILYSDILEKSKYGLLQQKTLCFIEIFSLLDVKQRYIASLAHKKKDVKKEIIDWIKSKAFGETITDVAAHLTEDNVAAFLFILDQARYKPLLPVKFHKINCQDYKDQLIDFVKLLLDRQYDEIYNRYFQRHFAKHPETLNPDFLSIVTILQEICREQIKCHKHFNHGVEFHSNGSLSPDQSMIVDFLYQKRITLTEKQPKKDELLNSARQFIELAALKSSMPLNSEISALTNQREREVLEVTKDHIITPMLQSLSTVRDKDVCVVPPKGPSADTIEALRTSNKKLGEEIAQLPSMRQKDVDCGCPFVDAVDVLIAPRKGKVNSAKVKSWKDKLQKAEKRKWRSDDVEAVLRLERSFEKADLLSNPHLQKCHAKATIYLKHKRNDFSSEPYQRVYSLRRRIYAQMVRNTTQAAAKNGNDFYPNLADNIKRYLWLTTGKTVAYDEQILKSHRFNSSTFNKMKSIIFSNNVDENEKLLFIQFLARDFRKDPLHNLYRDLSHFFSAEKTREGGFVRQFCTKFGKTFLHDAKPDTGMMDRMQFAGWISDKTKLPTPPTFRAAHK